MVVGDSPGDKNTRISFELYEVNAEEINPIYQEMSFHVIFNVKMVENILHKYQMVAGRHNTTTPYLLTYLSVVYQDSVKRRPSHMVFPL